MLGFEEVTIATAAAVDRFRKSRHVIAVWCHAVEAAKMVAKAGADVASRATVTVSHGPVSVVVAPKGESDA